MSGKYVAAYAGIGAVFLCGTVIGFQNTGPRVQYDAAEQPPATMTVNTAAPPASPLLPTTATTTSERSTTPEPTTTAAAVADPVQPTGKYAVVVAPTGVRNGSGYGTCAATTTTRNIPIVNLNEDGSPVVISKACVAPSDLSTIRNELQTDAHGILAFVCRATQYVYATNLSGNSVTCDSSWFKQTMNFPVAILTKESGCINSEGTIPAIGTVMNRGCLRIR